ncbi:hypothetical protein [Streptomyces sp. NPDC045251]|uniref:hypothetical protein n=1 Tax=unclassified Streptomyces TaxID=2593676 RepID=UPI0033EDE54D
MRISSAWKAVVGGISTGSAVAVTAVQDGTLTAGEGITVVLAVLGSFGLTWAVPNREPKGQA